VNVIKVVLPVPGQLKATVQAALKTIISTMGHALQRAQKIISLRQVNSFLESLFIH